MHASSLNYHHHMTCRLCVSVSKSPLFIRTPVIWIKGPPTPVWPPLYLTNYTCNALVPNKVTFSGTRVRIPTRIWWGHNSTPDNLETTTCDFDWLSHEGCSACLCRPCSSLLLQGFSSPRETTAAEVRGCCCCHGGCNRREQLGERLVCESQALSPHYCLSHSAPHLCSLPRLSGSHLWKSTWRACVTVKVWSLPRTFDLANDIFTKALAEVWWTPFLTVLTGDKNRNMDSNRQN